VQNLHCRWTQIPDVSGQKLPDDFGQIKQSATVKLNVQSLTDTLVKINLFVSLFLIIQNHIRTQESIKTNILIENEQIIRNNIKMGNPITFGITKENNWKNTWNKTQPKETKTAFQILLITIKTTIKIYIMTFIFSAIPSITAAILISI
jgi:hypothetical protein